MGAYKLSPRTQDRLEVPSGDSPQVINDLHELIGQGEMGRARFGRSSDDTYISSGGLVRATRHKHGFYTEVITPDPPSIPVLWLALRAYSEVAERQRVVGSMKYVARPAGLLVVRTSLEGLSVRLSEERESDPAGLEGVSVHPVDLEQEEAAVEPQSDIVLHRPGVRMPEMFAGLADAAERLEPDSLGADPADQLTIQLGLEDYDMVAEVWNGAVARQEAVSAALYFLGAYGMKGALEGV